MVLITNDSQFNAADIDAADSPIVGIAAEIGHHDSGMHHHRKAQLLYAPAGCMRIALDGRQCVLPPTRAAWIPPGVHHRVTMHNVVAYRSVYFMDGLLPEQPEEVKIIGVNPLLKALIERMAFWQWDMPVTKQQALLTLFSEELAAAPEEYLQLPLPVDSRLTDWLKGLASGAFEPEPLNRMAESIGASEKTISRIFTRETGMPYQSWRQQWRLLAAIELLAEGVCVADVAFALDFASDSAFISFFRQHTGETPRRYMHHSSTEL